MKDGVIDPHGKSDKQLRAELIEYFDGVIKSGKYEFQLITVHHENILRQARHFVSLEQIQFAVVLYATWFEHWLNGMIASKRLKFKLSINEAAEIIREVSLRGKTSWLLDVLGYKKISQKHRNTILQVAEARNAFVHYKFKPSEDDKPDSEESKLKALLIEAERTIRYLKRYETKELGVGPGKVRRVLWRGTENVKPHKS